MTAAEVAKRLGITHQTVYEHYIDKLQPRVAWRPLYYFSARAVEALAKERGR